MSGLDQNQQIAALKSAMVLKVVVSMACSACEGDFEEEFAIATSQNLLDAADTAWNEGWEVHEGRVLCFDCTPDPDECKTCRWLLDECDCEQVTTGDLHFEGQRYGGGR